MILATRLYRLILAGLGLAAVCAAAGAGPQRRLPSTVAIGLSSGAAALSLRLPAGTSIEGSGVGVLVVEADYVMALSKGPGEAILSGGASLGKGPLRFSCARTLLAYNNRSYRGTLIVSCRGNGLTLINEVALEDYLRGVLPVEVNPAWPPEALKAQAVASRTYAVSRLGSHGRSGYDLCATTCCQVYAGAGVEKPTTDAAVAETAGRIITHNGRPISAVFHAASGGHTESVESVWESSPTPYLRGVPDPAESSPYGLWRSEIEWASAEATVAAKYPQLGKFTSISVIKRGEGGRAAQVELVGAQGKIALKGEAVRSLFSLHSTLFDLEIANGPVPAVGQDDLVNATAGATLAPSVLGLWCGALMNEWSSAPVKLIFTGRGWGHGVGMSQWGAKSLAEMGYGYTMILKHYYSGIEVEDWRSAAPSEQAGSAVSG